MLGPDSSESRLYYYRIIEFLAYQDLTWPLQLGIRLGPDLNGAGPDSSESSCILEGEPNHYVDIIKEIVGENQSVCPRDPMP